MFCCTLLYVHSSIAIILMGKRELVALLNLSSWCLVMVEGLFLAVPRGCLQFVVVVFPDHTLLLFFKLSLTLRKDCSLGPRRQYVRSNAMCLILVVLVVNYLLSKTTYCILVLSEVNQKSLSIQNSSGEIFSGKPPNFAWLMGSDARTSSNFA